MFDVLIEITVYHILLLNTKMAREKLYFIYYILSAGIRELQKQVSQTNDRVDFFQCNLLPAGPTTARHAQPTVIMDDIDDESIPPALGRRDVKRPIRQKERPPQARNTPLDDKDEDDKCRHSTRVMAGADSDGAGGTSGGDTITSNKAQTTSVSDEIDREGDDTIAGTCPPGNILLKKSHDKNSASPTKPVSASNSERKGQALESDESTHVWSSGTSTYDKYTSSNREGSLASPLHSPVRSAGDVIAGKCNDTTSDIDSITEIDVVGDVACPSTPSNKVLGKEIENQPTYLIDDTSGVQELGGCDSPSREVSDEVLSSAGSSVIPSSPPLRPHTASSTAKDFMESIDNSFDDSTDFMSPLAAPRAHDKNSPMNPREISLQQHPHSPNKDVSSTRHPDDDSDNSHFSNDDDNERSYDGPRGAREGNITHSVIDEGVVGFTSMAEDSEDNIKSFSLVSGSDDSDALPTRRHRTEGPGAGAVGTSSTGNREIRSSGVKKEPSDWDENSDSDWDESDTSPAKSYGVSSFAPRAKDASMMSDDDSARDVGGDVLQPTHKEVSPADDASASSSTTQPLPPPVAVREPMESPLSDRNEEVSTRCVQYY